MRQISGGNKENGSGNNEFLQLHPSKQSSNPLV